MTRRIGLLGGSCNPAHRGHRRISLSAHAALGLDEVWWLVSPGNPLKPDEGMAPFAVRLASAAGMARHAPIRVTGIEAALGTRYTAETLPALARHYPRVRFIWLMGGDNLVQFDRWRDWRRIAQTMPIAVIARPGYEGSARRAPAMGWLRRFVRRPGRAMDWTNWSLPALVLLRSPPDPRSATRIRAARADWHARAPVPIFHDTLTRAVPLGRRVADPPD